MRFIDFFAGIGGFRLGMEMAGHECVGHCEIDKYAEKSYRAMHDVKEGEWFATDIRTVEPSELPEADCYCGGFPCQSFSVAGKRRGFEDTRGTLFFEIMRLARIRKPKYLFLENVKGLLSHDGGRTFRTILNAMDELGYSVEWQVLNSKDFGVPQNRERVFIIGHLRGKSKPKVFPITGSNSKTLKQIVGGQQGNRVYDISGISCTLASQAGGQGAKTGLYIITDDGLHRTKRIKKNITPSLRAEGGGSRPGIWVLATQEIKKPFTINHCVLKETDIVNCLDGNYAKGFDNHGQRTGVIEVREILMPDRFKIRRLTPKECFRLQGFPDEYFERAAKVNSDTQLYKQAGNSVTVNVVYEIAKRLQDEKEGPI